MEMAFLSGGMPDILKLVNVSGVLPAFFYLVCTVLLVRFNSDFFNALGEKLPKKRLFLKQILVINRFILFAIGFVFIVTAILDLSGEGFSFFGGLILFGFSFASRDLIASLMAGLILLFDRPFQVGDRIAFAGHYGEVVEIGLRSVQMVDLDDNLISIPNNKFLSDTVASSNAGELNQMSVFRFYIGPNEDFDLAMELIREAIVSSQYTYWYKKVVVFMKEKPISQGSIGFAIEITAKSYVIDGRYESAYSSDIHRMVKHSFRKYNIKSAGELQWNVGVSFSKEA
ncbi:MAG: mechanosensitive ion channel protein [Proteobacteria bacterium]|nr:mechanosensitive ion channel protein [Pseudomonadota bacterium]